MVCAVAVGLGCAWREEGEACLAGRAEDGHAAAAGLVVCWWGRGEVSLRLLLLLGA